MAAVAVAVAVGAEAISTWNQADFPAEVPTAHRARLCTPDNYLCGLLDAWPDESSTPIRSQPSLNAYSCGWRTEVRADPTPQPAVVPRSDIDASALPLVTTASGIEITLQDVDLTRKPWRSAAWGDLIQAIGIPDLQLPEPPEQHPPTRDPSGYPFRVGRTRRREHRPSPSPVTRCRHV